MGEPVVGWWFGAVDGKLPNGDGRIVRVGETHEHAGPLAICRSGLHASERIIDALKYAPGPMLYRVRCSGEIVRGEDKLVCSRREYLAGLDATEMLVEFARFCALDVSHLWDAPDVAIYWLLSGDPDAMAAARNAAWDAAMAAARNAVRNAAWDAARDAAGAAARAAQNTVLTQMAEELLGLEPTP